MSKKLKVVITKANRWTYFYWFLLGFYELEKEGKIKLKYELSFENWLSSNRYTRKIGRTLNLFKEDSYDLRGYILYPNNTKKLFCIDSADSPYLFNSDDLDKVDCYFKMQCPKDLNKDYFELTKEIHIPWLDHNHKNELHNYETVGIRGERALCNNFEENCYKIKPLMIGPRRLGTGISYRALKKGYDNYLSSRNDIKTKKVMCYFGNSMGPEPEKNVSTIDYDWEKDIVGYYKNKISHPNEKRAKVSEIINALGKGYDGRIITEGNSDAGLKENKNLVVPINDFCAYIAQFEYNFNVSGYRLSIPNRFIESFMVGTGIITDKLSVKWYLPFDKEEVLETEEMGYKKIDDINWDKVKKYIEKIPDSNPSKIIKCFEEKWAPKKVAEYILNEIKKS